MYVWANVCMDGFSSIRKVGRKEGRREWVGRFAYYFIAVQVRYDMISWAATVQQ